MKGRGVARASSCYDGEPEEDDVTVVGDRVERFKLKLFVASVALVLLWMGFSPLAALGEESPGDGALAVEPGASSSGDQPTVGSGDGTGESGRLFALTVAAVIAWFILAAFAFYQFRRQRRLVGELRRMRETLDLLERGEGLADGQTGRGVSDV